MSAATAPARSNSSPNSAAPMVFIVDDDISVRESLELLIRFQGWQAETFESAKEFLDRPRVIVPSCLVLDVSLPGLNGLELQKCVAVERAEMPIIFITGHGNVPMSVEAMKAGAVEFLTKPFSKDVLLSAVRNALDRSRTTLSDEAEMQALRSRYASLTPREREVMTLVISGLLNKQVGGELRHLREHGKVSPSTGDAKNEGRLSRRFGENGREARAHRRAEKLAQPFNVTEADCLE